VTSHAVSFAERVPLHEGRARRYFVQDCTCGWQSPLCESEAAAAIAYEGHEGAETAAGPSLTLAPGC
jgi:hypothetical protein